MHSAAPTFMAHASSGMGHLIYGNGYGYGYGYGGGPMNSTAMNPFYNMSGQMGYGYGYGYGGQQGTGQFSNGDYVDMTPLYVSNAINWNGARQIGFGVGAPMGLDMISNYRMHMDLSNANRAY